jgi:hypothetical protein
MKAALLGMILFLILSGCNNDRNKPTTLPSPDSLGINASLQPDGDIDSLNFIKKWKGKTAREVSMFDNPIIQSRFLELLGPEEYALLKSNWMVQTPFEEESGIYSASGCKQHDCPSYHVIIYFDLANNNINIALFKNKNFRMYSEKGEIILPPQMQKDIQTNKGNLKL